MIIKYRVWDKIKKDMSYVEAISFVDNKVYTTFNNSKKLYIPMEEAVLMQSTWIKDINGVAIYEGDIVKVTDDYGDTNFSDGVVGTICGLPDLMWYIDGQVQNGLYDIKQCYYIEVIGNIYQNKELLEAK